MNTSLDHYFADTCEDSTCHLHSRPGEKAALRRILQQSPLQETLKWGVPCYTHNKKNIVLINAFKDHILLSFFKGALLKDPHHRLEAVGNIQSARVMRFDDLQHILHQEEIIKAYLTEAITVEASGQKVKKKTTQDFPVPDELKDKLKADAAFKTAFEALTPGRQRGYLLHFAAAKQSATRTSRIEKYRSRIMDGKGLRDCVCGRSKKMPACDGSHQFTDS